MNTIDICIFGESIRFVTDNAEVRAQIHDTFSRYVIDGLPCDAPCLSVMEATGSLQVSYAGRTIDYCRESGVPKIDELLVFVLSHRRRDLMFIHASAVVCEDKAALFVGGTNTGKTTLALALDNEGFSLINDDLCAIELHSGNVRPLYLSSTLRPYTQSLSIERGWKMHGRETTQDHRSYPIGWVFLLDESGGMGTRRAVIEPERNMLRSVLSLIDGANAADLPEAMTFTLRGPEFFQRIPGAEKISTYKALHSLLQHSRHPKPTLTQALSFATAHLQSTEAYRLRQGYLDSTVELVCCRLNGAD